VFPGPDFIGLSQAEIGQACARHACICDPGAASIYASFPTSLGEVGASAPWLRSKPGIGPSTAQTTCLARGGPRRLRLRVGMVVQRIEAPPPGLR
jgi:hypothetical protein